MPVKTIIQATQQPTLYSPGNAFMWTDAHISTQLLNIHLNKEVDLASRKFSTIEKTVKWIIDHAPQKAPLSILDLGCGPGLYSELLAQQGHAVTGVDISPISIDHARKSAQHQHLNIDYHCENYVNLEINDSQFDLIILIYTDFGVLLPRERTILLQKIHQMLKPGGILIFDVLNDNEALSTKVQPATFEAVHQGFWSNTSYVAFSNSFLYEKEKVVLYQHNVFTTTNELKQYRFWTHFFSENDLKELMAQAQLKPISFHRNIIPGNDSYSGQHVTFCIAQK
tara:strand:- start:10748 stop:11593 length:846 start_codon:yes stop_codon:yes gene_type:complete